MTDGRRPAAGGRRFAQVVAGVAAVFFAGSGLLLAAGLLHWRPWDRRAT